MKVNDAFPANDMPIADFIDEEDAKALDRINQNIPETEAAENDADKG